MDRFKYYVMQTVGIVFFVISIISGLVGISLLMSCKWWGFIIWGMVVCPVALGLAYVAVTCLQPPGRK